MLAELVSEMLVEMSNGQKGNVSQTDKWIAAMWKIVMNKIRHENLSEWNEVSEASYGRFDERSEMNELPVEIADKKR